MTHSWNYRSGGSTLHDHAWAPVNRHEYSSSNQIMNIFGNNASNHSWNYQNPYGCSYFVNAHNYAPLPKRRKYDTDYSGAWVMNHVSSTHNDVLPSRSETDTLACTSDKLHNVNLEADESVFMSRDQIERCSPSRKDGINVQWETHLRYSYCIFLQNIGFRLELPQTTIGTAMVLCHRFFVRRSHACHDRFVIATAALFLAAKYEETPRPLNNVLREACEISHVDATISFLLPPDWFDQYRGRVIEAEQMILTTLNFELEVQHPFNPLASILEKLGFSQTMLVNLALNLVSEGVEVLYF